MVKNKENTIESAVPQPNTLDIIKVDGRWAQIFVGGDAIDLPKPMKYLDNGEDSEITFNDYEFTKDWKSLPVALLKSKFGETFNDEEITRIHWGSEQENNPELKEFVSVFGEYTKK